MAIEVTTTAGGDVYGNPFVGKPGPIVNLKVDVSTLTTAEVDVYGYLKPGVPFVATGTLGTLVSTTGQTIYGVTVEAQKLAGVSTNTALSGITADVIVAVATSGTINRDFAEDGLGRAYGANELTALALGGFKVTTT